MDLKDLYQDIILDHNKAPRNFGKCSSCSHSAEGLNPLCGDELIVYLNIEDGVIDKVTFEGTGCAISIASASLMTERLQGKPLDEAEKVFGVMHDMLVKDDADTDLASLGKLGALAGVKEYPSRVKCASLCWHALMAAINNEAIATTE
ncbi:MAG: Fe-S cluster assembly sulfur transfer protein SufU [Pseudomonadota bacterium]